MLFQSNDAFSAKQMWLHAGEAIQREVAKKSAPLDHAAMVRRQHTRSKYQLLFRSHLYTSEEADKVPKEQMLLPWMTTKISKQQKAEFKSLRAMLPQAELQAYEAAELLKLFAEKKKYWVEWHAANDGLRFYQSEVVIGGVILTADEEAEVRAQCGDVMADTDDNTFILLAELTSPGLEMLVSNSAGGRVASAKCQQIDTSLSMASQLQVKFGCNEISLEDCVTVGTQFPYIIGSAGSGGSPWSITYSSGGSGGFDGALAEAVEQVAGGMAPKLEVSAGQQLQIVLVPSWIDQVHAAS